MCVECICQKIFGYYSRSGIIIGNQLNVRYPFSRNKIFSFLTRPTEFRFAFGLTGVTRICDTHNERFVLIQVRNVNRQNELDGEREAARE